MENKYLHAGGKLIFIHQFWRCGIMSVYCRIICSFGNNVLSSAPVNHLSFTLIYSHFKWTPRFFRALNKSALRLLLTSKQAVFFLKGTRKSQILSLYLPLLLTPVGSVIVNHPFPLEMAFYKLAHGADPPLVHCPWGHLFSSLSEPESCSLWLTQGGYMSAQGVASEGIKASNLTQNCRNAS